MVSGPPGTCSLGKEGVRRKSGPSLAARPHAGGQKHKRVTSPSSASVGVKQGGLSQDWEVTPAAGPRQTGVLGTGGDRGCPLSARDSRL